MSSNLFNAIWFRERFRDLFMWPINLVRDWPARTNRLKQTAWQGGRSCLMFIPYLIKAKQENKLTGWIYQRPGQVASWLHLFTSQLFDVMGGPEIAQFLMHLITNTTPLTKDEIAMITQVLGPQSLRFSEIRIAEGGLFDLIFKVNGNLAFATWHTICLPRTGNHTRANLPILVHELTHVYQYERVGSRYLGEAIYVLVKTKRDCYSYGKTAGLTAAIANGKRYCDYNREQQAMITQDYFALTQHEADVSVYEPFIAQVRAGEI